MDFLASNGLFVGLHTPVVLYPVDNETGFPNTYLLDSGAILLLNNSALGYIYKRKKSRMSK